MHPWSFGFVGLRGAHSFEFVDLPYALLGAHSVEFIDLPYSQRIHSCQRKRKYCHQVVSEPLDDYQGVSEPPD